MSKTRKPRGARSKTLKLVRTNTAPCAPAEAPRPQTTPRDQPRTLGELCEQTLEPSIMARRPLTAPELAAIRSVFGTTAPIPKGGVAISPVNAVRAELDEEEYTGLHTDILLKPKVGVTEVLHEYAHWFALTLGPRMLNYPEAYHESWSQRVVGMWARGEYFRLRPKAACVAHFVEQNA